MKRVISVILTVLIFISAFSAIFAYASDDTEYKKGTVHLSYDDIENAVIEINGIRFPLMNISDKFGEVSFTVDGIDNTCYLYINDTELISFNKDGSVTISPDMLKEGNNEIYFVPATGSGAYNSSMVYGKYNEDDFNLNSFSFIGIDDKEIETKLVKYMPIEKSAGNSENISEYNGKTIAIGDGWYSSTGLGGSTPNVPVMVGFRFEYSENSGSNIYEIDTTLLPDGENIIKFYDTEKNVYLDKTDKIYVNNSAPQADFSVKNLSYVSYSDTLNVSVNQVEGTSKLVSAEIYLDDTKLQTLRKTGEYEFDKSSLSIGRHTIYVVTKDKMANVGYYFLFFTYIGIKLESPVITGENTSANLYGASLVKNINMYVNSYGTYGDTSPRNSYEELVQFSELGNITTSSDLNTIPYQSFLIDVSNITDNSVVVNCNAETGDSSAYGIAVYDYASDKWNELANTPSGNSLSIKINLDKNIVSDGKIRVRIYPHENGNGSDTMLWYTDTQYLSAYEDLNFLYESMMKYTAEEYTNGNIAYALFTGDFVDDARSADVANKQYTTASKLQEIIEDAGVPHGVLAGNHDVAHTDLNYEYFCKYFPSSRYSSEECYGGSLNNNQCHYDLITVGGYNFVILCLGYGKNADEDTVAWANAVLQSYPDYNAIIATHEYIDVKGQYLSTNAINMWDKIVVPNENVKMILCGHYEGACNQVHQVEGTDRYVVEILHDYQFAELNQGPKHIVNSMTCDGEAFLRLMKFTDAGEMIMSTYSPYYDLDNYFAPYEENYTYDLNLQSVKSIKTTAFYVSYNNVSFDKNATYDAVYAIEGDNISDFTVSEEFTVNTYKIGDNKSEPKINTSKIDGEIWYDSIEPTLFRGTDSVMPSSDVAECVYNLLPEKTSVLQRESGVSTYSAEYNENNGLVLTPLSSEYNWISVGYAPKNITLSDAPYIYFSVQSKSTVKWGIQINTNKGQQLHFALTTYKVFGYEEYSKPSDILGTWQGYFDLSPYISEGEKVTRIYFVSAMTNEDVVFDYVFLGNPCGKKVCFYVDDVMQQYDVAENGIIESPTTPFKEGKVFAGWCYEDGTKAQFPLTVTDDIKLYASFEDAQQRFDCVYYDDEVSMAEIAQSEADNSAAESDDSDGSSLLYIIIAAGAVVIIAVALFITKKKK